MQARSTTNECARSAWRWVMALVLVDSLLAGLDDLYFRLKYGASAAAPLFAHGWGSDAAIAAVITRFKSQGRPAEVKPEWDSDWRDDNGFRFRDASFETPLFIEFLPPECAYARLRFYMPREETNRAVVIVPTRFEEGYGQRKSLAVALARRGIGSVLLESPFMGSRRPSSQPTVMLAVLSDLLLMGGAAIEEARSATLWLQRSGFDNICVTGLSMGGYVAAVVGALARPPVSIVTLLAPHHGNVVYLDGLSHGLCNWRRMQESCGAGLVEEKIRAVFDAVSLEHVPEPKPGRFIAIAATCDRFVPPVSYHMMKSIWPSIEIRWVRGGHISVMLRRSVYIAALLDAMQPDSVQSLGEGARTDP